MVICNTKKNQTLYVGGLSSANGVGGVRFSGEKHYKGVRFNVISITRGCVGSNSQEKSVSNT